MATLAGKAYHPVNGASVEVWEGFSWPCFFFGSFWFAYKSMWGWAVASGALALVTFWISWVVLPFYANGLHAKYLLTQGYLTEEQWRAKQAGGRSNPASRLGAASVADDLTKLARLHEQGLLTRGEYDREKARLLK